MSDEKSLTFQRLSGVLQRAPEIPLEGRKYAVISDIHLGDGGRADDFRNNEETLGTALQHYRNSGYTLILLGDIEELWQFEL